MILNKCTKLTIAALVAGSAAFAGQASAQSNTQTAPASQPTPQMQAPAPSSGQQSFSDEKLESFAVAFLEVDKVNKEYGPKMQQAKSEDEQNQVREEASTRMVQAVEKSDNISVQEYNEIIRTAQTDQALAQKIGGFIREKSGGSAQPAQ